MDRNKRATFMYEKESKEVVRKFWRCISSKQWNEISSLLSEEFEIYSPQSKMTMGRDEFLSFNEKRFKNSTLELLNINHDFDQWDKISTVITQVHAYANPADKKISETHIISFFEVDDEKIISLVEYRT